MFFPIGHVGACVIPATALLAACGGVAAAGPPAAVPQTPPGGSRASFHRHRLSQPCADPADRHRSWDRERPTWTPGHRLSMKRTGCGRGTNDLYLWFQRGPGSWTRRLCSDSAYSGVLRPRRIPIDSTYPRPLGRRCRIGVQAGYGRISYSSPAHRPHVVVGYTEPDPAATARPVSRRGANPHR